MSFTIEYRLFVLPEEDSPEGQFEDPDQLAHVLAAINTGNPFAWFTAKVTATIEFEKLVYEGADYLGGCSYNSKEDFCAPGGYWDDMKKEALSRLMETLKYNVRRGEVAAYVLEGLPKAG